MAEWPRVPATHLEPGGLRRFGKDVHPAVSLGLVADYPHRLIECAWPMRPCSYCSWQSRADTARRKNQVFYDPRCTDTLDKNLEIGI
jgi:hypothetical protein